MVARSTGPPSDAPFPDAPARRPGHAALPALAREHARARRARWRGRERRFAARRDLARLDRAMRACRRGATAYQALLAAAPVLPAQHLGRSRDDPLSRYRAALTRAGGDPRLATAPRLSVGGVTFSLIVIGSTPVLVQGLGQWLRIVRAGRATTRRAVPCASIVTACGGAVTGRDERRASRACAEARALLHGLGSLDSRG